MINSYEISELKSVNTYSSQNTLSHLLSRNNSCWWYLSYLKISCEVCILMYKYVYACVHLLVSFPLWLVSCQFIKKKGLFGFHFRGLRLWLLGPAALMLVVPSMAVVGAKGYPFHLLIMGKPREDGTESQYPLQGHASMISLLPTRLCS